MYSKGCTDKGMVIQIQKALKVVPDGIFGTQTENAVRFFQNYNNIVADGIVGPQTLFAMGILDTDMRTKLAFTTREGLVIQKHHLPKGEYIQDTLPILNDYLILHHTAGWENPNNVIDSWGRDQRGAIATEFVIGGQKVTDDNEEYDGVIVQAFPEGCQGWHIGASNSYFMNRHSVGIEVCSFGQLNEAGKTYTGIKVKDSQKVTLAEPYKGISSFHRYSDKQLYSLKRLIQYIAIRDSIDVHIGLIQWINKMGPTKAFEFQQDAWDGKVKGLLCHGNIIKEKMDMFPQAELVDMLLTL